MGYEIAENTGQTHDKGVRERASTNYLMPSQSPAYQETERVGEKEERRGGVEKMEEELCLSMYDVSAESIFFTIMLNLIISSMVRN